MIPVNNGDNSPCSPISSNCVIWQGPDISCINLCNGDTVSDVVNKLATELCTLIDASCTCNPDISGLDLGCLPAETTLELQPVLQAIITYICDINTTPSSTLPNVTLPSCLQYDDALGNPVTALRLDLFAELLGNRICNILSDINSINLAIVDLQSRVTILENCVLPCTPNTGGTVEVLSSCLFPGQLVSVADLILALETDFCNLRNAVGSVAVINTAISTQCIFGTTERLSGSGTYGSLTGWVSSPTNLAQSNIDQWLVICDLYTAVKDIQENCCDTGCDGVVFGATYTTIDSNGDGVVETLNLNFTSSNIPSGFNDCGGATVVTITDSDGTSITQSVDVTSLSSSPTGALISLAGLNTLNSLSVSIPFCVTDGTSQCAETQSFIVPLNIPCPTNITAVATGTDIVVGFTNALGTGVTYVITAIDTTTGTPLSTTTITNPPAAINHIFSGAIPGRTYNIIVTVTQGVATSTCTPVSVAVPGTTCNNLYVINTTGTTGADDIYLGHEISGANIITHHYNPVQEKIVVSTSGIPVCDAPYAPTYSMDVSGNITIDLQYGTGGSGSGVDIETSFSVDGITYGATTSGGDGVRVIGTGITSGTVYLRARQSCGGSDTSEYLILKYDFSTDFWTVIANPSLSTTCINTSIPDSCPMGVEVATQTLECDGTNYNVDRGGAGSKWFYVGKYVRSGNTVYVYAGWDEGHTYGYGCTTILECCVCPAFILNETIQVFCAEGNTATFTIPYVLGEGTPEMTIVTLPVNGTLTQSTSISNQFTYENTVPGEFADTFTVSLQPSVTGVCEEATATIQIQIIPCAQGLQFLDQPVFAFIDTGSFTATEGGKIKQGLTDLATDWGTSFGYTGRVYFIPVADNNYVGYQKSIVDDGASATLDADPAWVALRALPDSWGSGIDYKDNAFMIAFVNTAATDYHNATLADGFTGQPTRDYQDDYDTLIDSTTGSQSTGWAQALGLEIPTFGSGLNAVVYPFTSPDSSTAPAALILQSLASYTGIMIPPAEYGIKTVIDVSGYLMQGLIPSASNPYNGFTTANSNVITGLYKKGFLAFLNNPLLSDTYDEINANENEQFKTQLTLAATNCDGSYPTGSLSVDGFKVQICSTNTVVVVEWSDATTPAVGEIWQFTDPVAGVLCGRIMSGEQRFGAATYEAQSATTSLIAGCETCATDWLVEDCATGSQYVIEGAGIAATGLHPGLVLMLTNTGASFNPSDGRADWNNGDSKCVQLLYNDPTPAVEITSVTQLVPDKFDNCAACVLP